VLFSRNERIDHIEFQLAIQKTNWFCATGADGRAPRLSLSSKTAISSAADAASALPVAPTFSRAPQPASIASRVG
jgi:hypothetical protein